MTRRPESSPTNSADEGQESLLARWSRRKQHTDHTQTDKANTAYETSSRTPATSDMSTAIAATREASASLTDDQPPPAGHLGVADNGELRAEVPTDQGHAEQCIDEQCLDEHEADKTSAIELPDPETLMPDADVSAFMQTGVDPALRQQALRRIFMGGEHSLRDGLDDYDQDFSKMRPLADGVAETLRRWTHKVEESLATQDQEDQNEEDQEQPAPATGQQDTALDENHEKHNEADTETQHEPHDIATTAESVEPQREADDVTDSAYADDSPTAAQPSTNDTSRLPNLPG